MGVRSDRNQDRGSLLPEIALVSLLVVALAVSMAEIGRYLAVLHGVNAAAAQAAEFAAGTETDGRTGTPAYRDCSEIKWAATAGSGLAVLGPTDVEVGYRDGAGRSVHSCTDANLDPDPGAVAAGSEVVITVRREVTPLSPPISELVGPLTISASRSHPGG